METIKGNGFVKFNPAAPLSAVLLVSGGASAKDHKAQESGNPADVVAHISFGALSAVDMAIRKKVNDKYYLWVQAAASAPILRREE